MKIIQMEVGVLDTNCYIAYCEETLKAAVIDPGGDAEKILAAIKENNLSVSYIINTHGHSDHIMDNNKIKQATGAAILIHEQDAGMLTNANKNLSSLLGVSILSDEADRLLTEDDIIEIGNIKLKVIHTSGHTKGGICLLSGQTLFSGDTLFYESIGRCDFPGGSHKQLIENIKTKLLCLDDDVKVFPGHGPSTTIGSEKKTNPFVK